MQRKRSSVRVIYVNAKEIASFLKTEIMGDPQREVEKVGYLHTAKRDELAYCHLKDVDKDLRAIRETRAGIVICQRNLRAELKQYKLESTLILTDFPKYDFARVVQEFFVSEPALISPLSHVDTNVEMGRDVDIHPHVTIYRNTKIGNRVRVRANAVLGSEGDYGRNSKGELRRVPHVGRLIVEDDVDIGSNTTIQRGILRPTIIGNGTKIGPNCDIGHEVRIGRNCIITGMTLIAGATEIGDNTYIAPHSTIRNSVRLGSNVFVGIGSLVINNVPDGATVLGRPAIEIVKFKERMRRLKELLGED
jgi:UDP-3-O-[3-hydroxymyristoyl] glucosamine N-acyltransferase